ncbi:PAS domain-containing protein [Shimia thalassica]|uniref:PAS domain-containing protein n=1 Tax=Shimia thalassica TaxID=1715693 RepID=UPI001C08ED25|nr:PAS domain-containing protein [Shimia thalassica]MBU2941595.1 PAS domain-containing protein [Shimia thalassica]MDO6504024.1 PAS domain-containing protein [Shimia thalassica]
MWSIGGSKTDAGKSVPNRQTDPHLLAIEEYWESLRNTRCVPPRAEVDPRSMQKSLGQAFILERIAPGMARFRVAGHLVSDLMGVDVRGMPLSALITPDSRDGFRDVLEQVFRGPAKATLQLATETGLGRPSLNAEMLLLPLSGHRGDVSRVLGGVSFTGQIGARPHRLALKGSFLRQLKRPVGAFHEGTKEQSRPTQVSYLRVVEA